MKLQRWKQAASALLSLCLALTMFPHPGALAEEAQTVGTGLELFVAPNGNDAYEGTIERPFATLERARNEIRERKSSGGLPAGGATVYLRGGVYERTASFALDEIDSGTVQSPIVYRSYPGEEAKIVGSRSLPSAGFGPVSDPSVRARLSEEARDHIVELSLPQHGITEYGTIQRITKDMQTITGLPELIVNGSPMTIARWPNSGYARTGPVANSGSKIPVFEYLDQRIERWATFEDVWLFGYFTFDWASETLPIRSIDRTAKTIASDQVTLYGVKQNARYYYFNSLEELDAPGEWYIDRLNGMLYMYPPGDLQESGIRWSFMEAPLVEMNNVSHVTFKNVTFTDGRTNGIVMNGGTKNRIEACTLRNFANRAVMVNGGTHHLITDSTIYDTGNGAISVLGGNRYTLTHGHHAAVNNHIYRYGRIKQASTRAIELHGVGNRAAHNEIHDAPHQAILLKGNNHIVEYNEIYNVVNDTEDAGAVYIVRDWTEQGNIIRYNYFQDIKNNISTRTAAIYLDDRSGGQYLYGNIFRNVSEPVKLAGRHNLVMNNVMIDSGWAVYIGTWGGDESFLRQRLSEMPYQQEPWRSRYPSLVTILEDEPSVPKYNVVQRNVFVQSQDMNVASVAMEHGYLYNNWTSDTDPGFVDVAGGYYQLNDQSPVFVNIRGFERIPVERIGRHTDAERLESLKVRMDFFIARKELTRPLKEKLDPTLQQVTHHYEIGQISDAAYHLEKFLRHLSENASLATATAKFALENEAETLLTRWKGDKFGEVQIIAPRKLLDLQESVRLWTVGNMLSGSYTDLFGQVNFTSSNPHVAEVDSYGTVTSVAPGETVITATYQSNGTSYTAYETIKVSDGLLKSVALETDNQVIRSGTQAQVTVAGTLTNGNEADLSSATITFSGSDDHVASINSSTGMLTAHNSGLVKITAKVRLEEFDREASLHFMVVNPNTSTDLPAPWRVINYGQADGMVQVDNGTFRVGSNGENVWNSEDSFTYVTQDVYKDTPATKISISATVNALDRIDSSTAGGIMMRDHEGTGSKNIFLRMTTNNRLQLTWRTEDNGATAFTSVPASFPAEIKLEREGNVFTALYKTNGVWQVIASKEIAMDDNMLAGISLFSGTLAAMTTMVVEDFNVTKETLPLTSAQFDGLSGLMGVGDTASLKVRGYVGNHIPMEIEGAEVVYEIVEGADFVVLEAGTIRAVAEGSAVLKATVTWNGVTVETLKALNVILPKPMAFDMSKVQTSLMPGEQLQLQIPVILNTGRVVNLSDLSVTDVVYGSQHPEVATVDGNGIVTAHRIGIANITVQITLNGVTLNRSLIMIVHGGVAFEEGFEAGLDAWSIQNGKTPVVNTNVVRSGSHSFKLTQDHQVIYHPLAEPTKGAIEVWIHDDGATNMQSGFIVDDRFIGVMKLYPNHYAFRYGSNVSAKNPREAGWHQVVYVYNPNLKVTEIYIDGVLASRPALPEMTVMKIADGWLDGIISALYFDDIRVYNMQSSE